MSSYRARLIGCRYLLRDSDSQPLPEVAQEAADVLWRPGRRLDAA